MKNAVKNPSLIKSILFSALGAILGAGVYVLLYYLNIISGLAIFLIFAFSYMGYQFGGDNSKIKIPFIICLSTILSFLSFYIGIFITIVPYKAELLLNFNINLNFFNVLSSISKVGNVLTEALTKDFIWFAVFLVLSLIWFASIIYREKKAAKLQKSIEDQLIASNNVNSDDENNKKENIENIDNNESTNKTE